MMILRLIVSITTRSAVRNEFIKKYIKSEIINVSLVFACVILDRTLILSNVEFSWSIAVIFTMLVILDEITSIASEAGETLGSKFVISTIKKIKDLSQNK